MSLTSARSVVDCFAATIQPDRGHRLECAKFMLRHLFRGRYAIGYTMLRASPERPPRAGPPLSGTRCRRHIDWTRSRHPVDSRASLESGRRQTGQSLNLQPSAVNGVRLRRSIERRRDSDRLWQERTARGFAMTPDP